MTSSTTHEQSPVKIDPAALVVLMLHATNIARIVLGRNLASEVDDVVQASMEVLVRKLQLGVTIDKPKEFIAAVARNHALRACRSRAKMVPLDIDLLDTLTAVENSAGNNVDSVILIKALRAQADLTERQWQVFLLREYVNLTARETAERLGVSTGSVERSLGHARSKIKKWREQRGSDTPGIDGRA